MQFKMELQAKVVAVSELQDKQSSCDLSTDAEYLQRRALQSVVAYRGFSSCCTASVIRSRRSVDQAILGAQGPTVGEVGGSRLLPRVGSSSVRHDADVANLLIG